MRMYEGKNFEEFAEGFNSLVMYAVSIQNGMSPGKQVKYRLGSAKDKGERCARTIILYMQLNGVINAHGTLGLLTEHSYDYVEQKYKEAQDYFGH